MFSTARIDESLTVRCRPVLTNVIRRPTRAKLERIYESRTNDPMWGCLPDQMREVLDLEVVRGQCRMSPLNTAGDFAPTLSVATAADDRSPAHIGCSPVA